MRIRIRGAGQLAIALHLAIGAAGAQSAEDGRLARFKEKVRQDMLSVPNYTCLETIDRARREPHSRDFKHTDTIRLEVSSVSGKELFAWPGSRQFEDRELTTMITTGTIGSGMFATFARNLFVGDKGTRQYAGEENLNGHASVRYDFQLTAEESHWEIRIADADEIVGAKGSFWFDPASLDLLRFIVHADSIPYKLRLEDVSTDTEYARVRINETDALLPKRSELTLAHFTGEASRTLTQFSQCRAYLSQSTISFDAPPTSPGEAPKPQVREIDLPAGLFVPVQLEAALDTKTASVGDTVRARVIEDVRHNHEVVLPRGAMLTGHIRRMGRVSASTPFMVGIDLSEVEWTGAHGAFYAALADVDAKSAGQHRPLTFFDGHAQKVLIGDEIPGAGIIYFKAAAFRIASGFRMTWRTLGRPPGDEQQ